MKKALCLILIILIMLFCVVPICAEDEENEKITIMIDSTEVICESLPYMKNGWTMVPIRAIFEALGATVTWDDETKTAISVKDSIEVKITIGEKVLYKNGEAIELGAIAEIKNSRTMIPIRAISEAFGCKVNWNSGTKTVRIIPDDGLTKIWYIYDEAGRLIYREEKTGIWVYTYDENGNVVCIDGPEIGYYEYTYDENGNVILYKSYNGYVVEYQYDENGNKTWEKQSYYRSGLPKWSQAKLWKYNENGQCISSTSSDLKVTTYTYDDNGNLSKEVGPDGAWKKYIYDENNNLIYWENSRGGWEKYEYDERGNITKREDSDGTVIVYTYDENNNKTYAEFTHGKAAGTYYRYEYDANGCLIYSENN